MIGCLLLLHLSRSKLMKRVISVHQSLFSRLVASKWSKIYWKHRKQNKYCRRRCIHLTNYDIRANAHVLTMSIVSKRKKKRTKLCYFYYLENFIYLFFLLFGAHVNHSIDFMQIRVKKVFADRTDSCVWTQYPFDGIIFSSLSLFRIFDRRQPFIRTNDSIFVFSFSFWLNWCLAKSKKKQRITISGTINCLPKRFIIDIKNWWNFKFDKDRPFCCRQRESNERKNRTDETTISDWASEQKSGLNSSSFDRDSNEKCLSSRQMETANCTIYFE